MAQHAAWFASLPADELTGLEHGLRKVILKMIHQHDGPFPLGAWVDRRIGGEIESRRDENGDLEVFLRGASGAPRESGRAEVSKEAFFKTLAPDAFAPAEEALRDACFEFLAAWRSPELATLRDLSDYPAVLRCAQQFLPRSVPIREWIDHRVGGEITFRKGRGGGRGSDIIHLTDAAKGTVMGKYHQLATASMMPPHMGHLGMPMSGPPPPGPPPPAAPPSRGGKDGNEPDKETFFGSLPTDELLPGELALREALLNWFKGPRFGRNAHNLSCTGGDPSIKQARAEILPKSVKFAEWIERRIGGEVELRSADNGQYEIYLRGAEPVSDRTEAYQKVQATPEEKEAFFDFLPQDEFSPLEEGLREGLLKFLEGHAGPEPALLGDAVKTEEVKQSRRKLLPRSAPVSLQEWIDRRIGGELETRTEDQGKIVFGHRGTLPPPGAGPAKRNDGAAAKRRRL